MVESPVPFVPESVTLQLEPSYDDPNVDWPFDVPASQMALEPGVVCLTGDDVGPLGGTGGLTVSGGGGVRWGGDSCGACATTHTRIHAPQRSLPGCLAAEAAFSAAEVADGAQEVDPADRRPEDVDEHELGIGRLPEEEPRQARLAGGADQEVRVG